jgi:predicted acylesterase/phospholipase RssA
MTRPIQLAIQGGGAKIAVLLAALEAVQELEQQGVVRVTRIAGTSAGAIAGCLYAAKIKMDRVRRYLTDNAARLTRAYPPVLTKWQLLQKLRKSEPFWDVDELRSALDTMFSEAHVSTFGDLKKLGIPVSIVASDITNMKLHSFTNDDEPIVNALISSAAIPFFFRGPSRLQSDPPLIVDGGVCENLPADLLADGVPGFGDVIGISFARRMSLKNPTTFLSFSKALLETAMENSTARARRRLGPNLCEIETPIDTFDFEKALGYGLGPHYDDVRKLTYAWFTNTLAAPAALPQPTRDFWQEESAYSMSRLAQVYEYQHAHKLFHFERSRVTIRAYSLFDKEHPSFGPDEIIREHLFRPAKEPLECYKVWVSAEATGDFVKTTPSVFDRHGRTVQSVLVPVRLDPSMQNSREFILFFLPSLQADDDRAPYQLRIVDLVFNSVGGLKTASRRDEIAIGHRRADAPVPKVDLVIFVPEAFAGLQMSTYLGSPPGTPIPRDEIERDYPSTPALIPFGWTGTDVSPQSEFGCILEL